MKATLHFICLSGLAKWFVIIKVNMTGNLIAIALDADYMGVKVGAVTNNDTPS
jgi:hypothetical protein